MELKVAEEQGMRTSEGKELREVLSRSTEAKTQTLVLF